MRATLPVPPDELLADPLYTRLKDYVIDWTGLAYYADKDADLARRIRRRLSNFNATDCAAYLDLLQNPGRGPAELEALIAEIAIGETYFFRHPEHFDALRRVVLPDLIARNANRRRLRIWCAGCADGAEPYSLSILLRREMGAMLAGWNVTILGTDINRQCIAFAQEGRYEEWALRATSEELRQACFLKEGKRWTIAPAYREGVAFQFHNLVEDGFPSEPDGFDLIICRNVMIYFAPHQMRQLVEQFHDGLTDGGWLLVGPSEPNMTCFHSFRAVNAPGVTLYQKAGTTASKQREQFRPSAALEMLPLVRPLPQPAPTVSTSLPSFADLCRHADAGEWESAARGFERLLQVDSLNPLVHFHHALVLEQMGSQSEAERSLRRTIYLDRQSALAHYHLGLLLRSRGDRPQAARSFDNTLSLLLPLPDSESVPGAEGLTVAQLRTLAETQIETMDGSR